MRDLNLKKHLLKVGVVVMSMTLFSFFFLDQMLSVFFAQPENKKIFYKSARFVTDFGLFEYYFLFALILFILSTIYLRVLKNKEMVFARINPIKNWSLNFIAALLISGVVTHIIKFVFGRQRPHKSMTLDPYIFEPFNTHWHWHSFSSGHSQVIFTVATILIVTFPKKIWLWILLALVIAFTRVVVLDHFLSDIIAGGFVGYAATLLTLKFFQNRKLIVF